MPKRLTAIAGKAALVDPQLDVDGHTLIGLNVTVNVQYKDLAANDQPFWTQMIHDGWADLSPDQKANMQDIRDTIVAAIVAQLS